MPFKKKKRERNLYSESIKKHGLSAQYILKSALIWKLIIYLCIHSYLFFPLHYFHFKVMHITNIKKVNNVRPSQVAYVIMVGNETLRPLGVAMGNAVSVTRVWSIHTKTQLVAWRQPMMSLRRDHIIKGCPENTSSIEDAVWSSHEGEPSRYSHLFGSPYRLLCMFLIH